ncbi:TnsD family Tn7-like transposition protein [Mesobacillus jeotgali]|uniref:TnsD family Tn7-like transposition protein n=1 Tax=Mesobacillus jeotgali TaxID=129985 RepID=A0ABY9VK79_9BACI|nr:TnsD family Tn7-like transposition protein [Mesobacillus jeotgali]WNF23166.1 TnsD family Tn7-like transposition protein [Mesobacillus jeotgali]
MRAHTLYFFYSNFILDEEKVELNNLLEGNRAKVNRNLNEKIWSKHPVKRLRYCPECLIENTSKFGEDYWHLSHQIPTVFMCPQHQTLLNESSISISESDLQVNKLKGNFQEESNPRLQKKTIFHLKNLTDASLFLNESDWNLKYNINFKLYFLLINKGYVTTAGEINILKLEKAIINHYGIEFLKLVGFNLFIIKKMQINPLLFHMELNPIETLSLILFLSGSLERFIAYQYRFPSSNESPFECTNPHCNETQSFTFNRNSRIINGKIQTYYECKKCNFLYCTFFETIKWRRLETRILESKALTVILSRYNYNNDSNLELVANKLNFFSSLNLERYLLNKKITPVSDEIKKERRMEWLEIVNLNLGLSPIELKHLYFSLYSFLYCYDLEWLNQQICKLNKVTPCDNYTSKVLIKRDRKVLLYLKDIVKKGILWGSTDVFLWINREIEILDLHDELPYLKKTFNYIEKHRQFYSQTQKALTKVT